MAWQHSTSLAALVPAADRRAWTAGVVLPVAFVALALGLWADWPPPVLVAIAIAAGSAMTLYVFAPTTPPPIVRGDVNALLRAHAHDIRHPLANIEATLAAPTTSSLAASPFSGVAENVRSLRNVVEDLLALTSLHDLAAQRSEVEVDAFVTGIVHELDFIALATQRHIDTDCAALGRRLLPLPLLRRVLHNLLGNALTHARGRHIQLRARADGNWLRIDIANDTPLLADDGRGATTRIGGLGIGICEDLCRAVGGTCGVLAAPPGRRITRVLLPAPCADGRMTSTSTSTSNKRVAWFDPYERARSLRRALGNAAIDIDEAAAAASIGADVAVFVDCADCALPAGAPTTVFLQSQQTAADAAVPATMSLQLPISLLTLEAALERAVAPVPATQPVASAAAPCVLVVDDDATARQWTAEMVRRAGFPVLTAANTAAALRHLTRTAISLALIDRHIGAEDGTLLIAQMRQRGYVGRACIVSADPPAANARHPWLQKPLTRQALQRLLTDPESDALPATFAAQPVATGPPMADELMQEFAAELARLADVDNAADPATLAATAHRLRGGAAVIGLHGIADRLHDVERSARCGNTAATRRALQALTRPPLIARGPRSAGQLDRTRAGRNRRRLRNGPPR